MAYTEQLSSALSPVTIDPQVLTNATTTSPVLNMLQFRRAMGFVAVGACPAGGIVTAALYAASTQSATYSVVPNSVINSISSSTKQAEIEMRADLMPSGTQWLKLQIRESGSQNVYVTGVLWAGEAAEKPASNANTTAVVQQLQVTTS